MIIFNIETVLLFSTLLVVAGCILFYNTCWFVWLSFLNICFYVTLDNCVSWSYWRLLYLIYCQYRFKKIIVHIQIWFRALAERTEILRLVVLIVQQRTLAYVTSHTTHYAYVDSRRTTWVLITNACTLFQEQRSYQLFPSIFYWWKTYHQQTNILPNGLRDAPWQSGLYIWYHCFMPSVRHVYMCSYLRLDQLLHAYITANVPNVPIRCDGCCIAFSRKPFTVYN